MHMPYFTRTGNAALCTGRSGELFLRAEVPWKPQSLWMLSMTHVPTRFRYFTASYPQSLRKTLLPAINPSWLGHERVIF